MPHVIKAKEQALTEEIVTSLIGKFVHTPTNMHEVSTPTGATTMVNVWFAGKVAGFEKAVIGFNYEDGSFLETPQTYFNVHLTDGMGYILTTVNDLEINEVTEEEFLALVEEHKESEDTSEMILPEAPELELLDGDK
ncbi:hypothetical protein RE628_17535 [Paenibacillus sp. D2_2]|uniref:hypothetical protein n=1 Tax=Paenibacillus sp. D2_2 TaxID=3073092 RepID=UPI002815377B|nr:hypothetical protein [Paenibacillus sp. D2_2]WMT39254.1 hypothetical protein RE628_17535 [Paenibacillus sp. D2_2]